MPKTNFSTEEAQVFSLALDLARNDYSLADGVTKRDLEQHLRDTINNDVLGGLTLFQAMRRNKIAIFEIVEEIVTTAIGENIMNSPFVEQFVEFKNRALGDETAFYGNRNARTDCLYRDKKERLVVALFFCIGALPLFGDYARFRRWKYCGEGGYIESFCRFYRKIT